MGNREGSYRHVVIYNWPAAAQRLQLSGLNSGKSTSAERDISLPSKFVHYTRM